MNVTLSIDPETVRKARDLARRRGTSLNQMIRDYLDHLTSDRSREAKLEELNRLWDEASGDSRGWKWNREELHDRSLLR